MALTTDAEIRSAIPNGDTLAGPVVTSLLAAADAAAKTYLGRNIESGTYTERVKASRFGETMFVKEFPVTAVLAVNIADSIALDVWSSATRATFSVISTGVNLRHWNGSAWVLTSITFAANPTLTALAAAITAVATWDSELSGEVTGAEPSDELAELTGPIDVGGGKEKSLYLLDGVAEAEWDYEDGSFEWSGFGQQPGEDVVIRYTGGYATVPADISKGVALLAAEMYAAAQSTSGMKSEKLGDYAYERFEGSPKVFTPIVVNLLGPYRDRMVAA